MSDFPNDNYHSLLCRNGAARFVIHLWWTLAGVRRVVGGGHGATLIRKVLSGWVLIICFFYHHTNIVVIVLHWAPHVCQLTRAVVVVALLALGTRE
jgi:hypothetical protein